MLDFEELQEASRLLGLPAGDDFVTDVLSQYDRNGDGVVSFEEYRTYVRRTERAMREAFARLDLDGKGHATPEGVLAELHRIGIKARWQDARRMVQLVDADGDGRAVGAHARDEGLGGVDRVHGFVGRGRELVGPRFELVDEFRDLVVGICCCSL